MTKNIGFLSYYGWGRGLAMTTLGYVKMLNGENNIFVLKQGLNPVSKDFQLEGVNVTEYPDYIVPKEFFRKWILDNNIQAVIFNEYKQWTDEPENLVKVAKDMHCKVYGNLVMERFKKEQTEDYDRILVQCLTVERYMRKNKVRKFVYTPYSIDLNEFPKVEKKLGETFTFFHPGGWGGVHNRKNTDLVIEAFRLLHKEQPNTKLVITSQKALDFKFESTEGIHIIDKNLSREELISYYYDADAVVLPSKWETIGIPILEALAAGVPVITSDAPPMNEFVRTGMNGYLCKGSMKKFKDIEIFGIEIEANELRKNMENIMNKDLHPILSRNARYVVEKFYNLEENKKYFLDFIREDLK